VQTSVVMVKPGGTGSPMRLISARFAPLPPSSGFMEPLPSAFLLPNRYTYLRAYLELEREGIVTMRQGFGTTVAQVKTHLPRREKLRLLAEPADVLLTNAHHLDVGLDEVVTLLRERDAAMQPESSK
jgi:hypothetical protein